MAFYDRPMLLGRDVVIAAAVRTPIGRGHSGTGALRDVHPSTLLAEALRSLVDRAEIDPVEVGDVVTGCVQQFGAQGLNIGRNAWLEAGLPVEVPAMTLDRQCGSGQQAVNVAASLVATGTHDVTIGCGVEHMGRISFADGEQVQSGHGSAFTRELLERYELVPQGISAELIAERWRLSRREIDAFSLRSHVLAARATDEGRFAREIAPVGAFDVDQGIRRDTTL
jgi:acetyl-CoA acetyltransferase